ncbi:unnamed protein product, partial [Iphiclides podalirius]
MRPRSQRYNKSQCYADSNYHRIISTIAIDLTALVLRRPRRLAPAPSTPTPTRAVHHTNLPRPDVFRSEHFDLLLTEYRSVQSSTAACRIKGCENYWASGAYINSLEIQPGGASYVHRTANPPLPTTTATTGQFDCAKSDNNKYRQKCQLASTLSKRTERVGVAAGVGGCRSPPVPPPPPPLAPSRTPPPSARRPPNIFYMNINISEVESPSVSAITTATVLMCNRASAEPLRFGVEASVVPHEMLTRNSRRTALTFPWAQGRYSSSKPTTRVGAIDPASNLKST